MLTYFQENPLQLAVVVAAFLLCAFAWYKALRAAKRRNAWRGAELAELEHEKSLRAAFKNPSRKEMKATPPARLVEGICCHIQMRLEKAEDMNAAFAALPLWEQHIYALGYVCTDTRKGLGHFFRANGKPLTTVARNAVQTLIGGEYAALFTAADAAFDEENEAVSFDKQALAEREQAFAALLQTSGEDALFARAKEYILSSWQSEATCLL